MTLSEPLRPEANQALHAGETPYAGFATAALAYAELGLPVFPLLKGRKEPAIAGGFKGATTDRGMVSDWALRHRYANIGVRTGPESNLLVVDVDAHKGGHGAFAELEAQLGPLPPTLTVETGNGGVHYYFRNVPGVRSRAEALGQGIDVKAEGGYVVGAGSFTAPDEKEPKLKPGGPYRWREGAGPGDVAIASLPGPWLEALLAKERPQQLRARVAAEKAPAEDRARKVAAVAEALDFIPAYSYEDWRRVGQVLFHEFGESGRSVWDTWSQRCPEKYDPVAQDRTWRSFATSHPTTVGSIMELARRHGADPAQIGREQRTGERLKKSGSSAQVDRLLTIAEHCELFHAPDGSGYADVRVDGRRATYPIRSKAFQDWLRFEFHQATASAPGAQAFQAAIDMLDAQARFGGAQRDVFLRVAWHSDRLYLDLADGAGRVIDIGPDGWSVIEEAPVRFRRTEGMRPLPVPEVGGSLDDLRPFLNVEDAQTFALIKAFLVAALRPSGPYPVLVFTAEQGGGKSFGCRILRSLIDPADTPLRGPPRNDRDLFVAVHNNHMLAFDNLSGLPHWLSDDLCRLATGGGFSTRKLYTDLEETRVDAQRPIILNGIDDCTGRPDLADRALLIRLGTIPAEARKTESELLEAFELVQGRILGALCDAVSRGLRNWSEIAPQQLGRMADFARWAIACEEKEGEFKEAFEQNQAEKVALVAEDDLVAEVISDFARHNTHKDHRWTGTAAELLQDLRKDMPWGREWIFKNREWPQSPRAFSGRVRRVAPALRAVGVHVKTDGRDGRKKRLITIQWQGTVESTDDRPWKPRCESPGPWGY